MDDTVESVTRYVALAVPITVAITSVSKIAFEWLNQRHAIKTSRVDQVHQITTHYLNKALDPAVPLSIRHQLLRFLAIPDKDGSRLSDWARAELRRIEGIIEDADSAVVEAEKKLLSAKSAAEISAAEFELALASRKKQSLSEPALPPPISAAALRAGLIEEKEIGALNMRNADLRDLRLEYRNLKGSDFSGSRFSGGRLQGCDLRIANFSGCDLSKVSFYDADVRGAKFCGANCTETDFQKAHLESADFTNCIFEKTDVRATYDKDTIWPKGFDPDAAGAVRIGK